ncbi:MAG: DedA family protein [Sphingobacteriales bacterium JAD_PAG50586_3]|nr:MAG: DedA family protein [Sphingobacteriales bacterium JAD_PAG50586_3]
MEFLDYFLHIDDKLKELIVAYDTWVYAILFAIIFIETGLVIWPFLPGDSLLFAAGIFAGSGELNIWVLFVLLFIAAVLGDTTNYLIGRYLGHHVTAWKYRGKPIVKQEWLDKTHSFYDKYGTRTIILARFVPIVRTIAPFVAGVGVMDYKKFISFNVIGGFVWIVGFVTMGYYLGRIDFVRNNLEIMTLGIVFISVLPMVYEIGKAWLANRKKA